MKPFPHTPDDDGLPPEQLREVNALLTNLCDELLEAHEIDRLGELLLANPAARRHYLRYVALHSALTASAGNCSATANDQDAPPVLAIFDGEGDATFEEHDDRLQAKRIAAPLSRYRGWLTAAAVLLGLGVVVWSLYRLNPSLPGDASGPKLARTTAPSTNTKQPLVAQITDASPTVRWQRANESYALTSRVRAGQTLAIAAGAVELTYASGTTLRLTGPSEFVVDEQGGKLQRGEIVAHVTEQGHGFTIQTPHGKIIDRGTDFGVVVDDFGVSEVSVFEGRVEAFPEVGSGPPAPRIDLTTGRALQWSGDSIIAVNAAHNLLRGPQANERLASSAEMTPAVVLDMPHQGEALDKGRWRTLGEVRSVRDGLRLDGRTNPGERPYLITAHEYDPSVGPLIITCEVRFDEIDPKAQPSFSILTRGANERSKPATTWHDMLASCVRATMKADLSSGEGMLEAGAKYEFDREPATISWRGFARPRPGTTYYLQMRDDGLNVWFTAAEAGNPSVSKTVTCRSLFRGNQNHIALEGFVGGVATVSNVRITQVRNRSDAAAELTHKSAAAPDGSINHTSVTHVFADAIPAKAQLRLADTFDSKLDDDRWMSLGDAIVEGGALQLGFENSDQHIDTWRQRPYLLTRQRFNSAEAPVVIIGRASFAANFLHGYGGSFAVLTRAEPEYGTGAGWEQSALRRGVRANFWPAALGQGRSLELFEMLSPEPLNTLATADFPIDPNSRSYLFCMKDDGASVSLTLIDAGNRNLRKTLSHATQSPSLSSGHIAFEGCWGAPVRLDDVHIFECPKSGSNAKVGDAD